MIGCCKNNNVTNDSCKVTLFSGGNVVREWLVADGSLSVGQTCCWFVDKITNREIMIEGAFVVEKLP